MNELKDIENLLNIVKSRIDAHLKFKKEYDKQLAFDFSLFQFFEIGENKISQVLAYFLDSNQNHGQGDIFLNEFVKTFYDKEIEIHQLENVCEKIITDNRRIDIYIKLKGLTIAIENKVWADDQPNQLKDYSTFLEHKSQGNYLLLYLSPYGLDPTSISINEELKRRLIEENKLKIISYKNDIINLINAWLMLCEADNVSHFLKEFRKYLEIKFLDKNTLNMSKELRTIIYENEREVQQLVNEYRQIERDIDHKIGIVGEVLNKRKSSLDLEVDTKISKIGPKTWEGRKYYKWSISKNGNIINMQLIRNQIGLDFNHSLSMDEDRKVLFENILTELKFKKENKIDFNKSNSELTTFFLNQVKIANESFRINAKRIETNE